MGTLWTWLIGQAPALATGGLAGFVGLCVSRSLQIIDRGEPRTDLLEGWLVWVVIGALVGLVLKIIASKIRVNPDTLPHAPPSDELS